MGKLKPIEQFAEDVNKGDLVRFILTEIKNEYTGYCCGKDFPFFYLDGLPSERTYGDFLDVEDGTIATRDNIFKTKVYEIIRRAKTQKGKESSDGC